MSYADLPRDEPENSDRPWERLSARVIWVDLLVSVAGVLPFGVAVIGFGIDPGTDGLWPLVGIAIFAVAGAIADIVRWAFTRYRVTENEIELRTGVLVRKRRSVRRERIRSVDTHARLRHRIVGLRLVRIGAGQHTAGHEAAFDLDALSTEDADRLRVRLLRTEVRPPEPDAATTLNEGGTRVLARFRPGWVIYGMISIWGVPLALGLSWSWYWLLSTFGINLVQWLYDLAVWDALLGGLALTIALGISALVVIGWICIGAQYLISNWNFELSRVQLASGRELRTKRGLLTMREVNRDESRMRGLTLSQPLATRWLGATDTNVITTGLGIWDTNEPTAILPRGPRATAQRVAAEALEVKPCPILEPLLPHPRAALRRRLWWATLLAGAVLGLVLWPVLSGAAPAWVLLVPAPIWVLALAGAVLAYRALGHAIVGDYLVVRSGLLTREVAALRRDAVSTVAVSQSILQRRLGLATVSAMTSAGYGIYQAPDMAVAQAGEFAPAAAPGLLDQFLNAG